MSRTEEDLHPLGGMTLLPWQRDFVDRSFSVSPGGAWTAKRLVFVAPRRRPELDTFLYLRSLYNKEKTNAT